jgi:hypothetical protein
MDASTDTNPLRGARVTVPEHLLSQSVGEETVLLDVQSGQYYGLDPVAARVWTLLSEHGDVELTVRTMLDEYDVQETRLREDVARLLRALHENGLVKLDAHAG